MTAGADHLGDLLSGLLDSELSPSEETAVRRHVAACPHCASELDQVGAAREWVRSMPQVEPPLGFIERLIREADQPEGRLPWFGRARPAWPERHGRERGWAARWGGVAALATSAAAAVAIVGFGTPREAPVRPPVGQLVEAHATGASLSGDPLSNLAPVGVPVSFKR